MGAEHPLFRNYIHMYLHTYLFFMAEPEFQEPTQ